jgi:hypothetical protein
MLTLIIVMIYVGGMVALFEIADDNVEIGWVIGSAFLWPVFVTSCLVEQFILYNHNLSTVKLLFNRIKAKK